MGAALLSVIAESISGAVGDPTFDPATGEPETEAFHVMIAASCALAGLRHWRAAEFAAPYDESVLEQSAPLEVGDESGNGLIHRRAAVVFHEVDNAVVVIPAAMIKLDEPHTTLGQAACEQAVATEGAVAGLAAVEAQHLFRFLGNIHQIGHAGLHFERHLVLRDARGDFGIVRGARLQIVELLHGIDHIALAAGIHAAGAAHVHHGIAGGPQLDALKLARQKSAMPHARGNRLWTPPGMRAKHHEPRQILRLAAEPVLDPRPHARPAADGGAGVHQGVGGIVVDGVSVHRSDDRQLIHVLRKMRKERRHFRAALPVFFERKLRAQTREPAVLQLRDRLPFRKLCRHRLAIHLHQLRLVCIKRLQMRRPTGHIKINDALHLRRMMQRPHHAGPPFQIAACPERRQ